MKTKYWVVIVGLGLGAMAIYLAGTNWRAHHQQWVSLNVRNAPLAEVLHKIEKQTGKKINAEKKLDARITLHVKNEPLDNVLDRIAQQAGARWSTLYAVYGSTEALNALDNTLREDRPLETAGWTKLAPKATPFDAPAPGLDDPKMLPEPGNQPAQVIMRKMVNGQMFIQGGNEGAVESWSPEELVADTRLKPDPAGRDIQTASEASAAETARLLGGKWTTRIALRKSVLGIGFTQLPHNAKGPQPLRRTPNDRFVSLTPDQRVLQARQRLWSNEEEQVIRARN
jgi:hypothetical protein